MTEAQAVQLDVLEAAVQTDFQERQSKAALAAKEQAEAEKAAAAAMVAAQEAESAGLKLAADLKKLKAFVDEILDPAVGIDLTPGTPTERA